MGGVQEERDMQEREHTMGTQRSARHVMPTTKGINNELRIFSPSDPNRWVV